MLLTEYIDYWKNLVAQHSQIKQFYRLNFEELNDALKEDVVYPILALEDYNGEIKKSGNGSKFMDLQHGSIFILDIFNTQNYDEEQQKLNNLKAYGFGIFAKIMEDINAENCPKLLLDLQPDSIKYYLTPYYKEHIKGWIFEFDFLDAAKDFIVNPTHWI